MYCRKLSLQLIVTLGVLDISHRAEGICRGAAAGVVCDSEEGMQRRRERLFVDLVHVTELEERPMQPSFADRQCGRQDWVRAALQVCDRMQPELGCVTDEEVRSE